MKAKIALFSSMKRKWCFFRNRKAFARLQKIRYHISTVCMNCFAALLSVRSQTWDKQLCKQVLDRLHNCVLNKDNFHEFNESFQPLVYEINNLSQNMDTEEAEDCLRLMLLQIQPLYTEYFDVLEKLKGTCTCGFLKR